MVAQGQFVPGVSQRPSVDRQQFVLSLRRGLGGTGMSFLPANATPEELKLWDQTHRAFDSSDVVTMLCNAVDILSQVFDVFADPVEGLSLLKLTTSANGGLYRLMELYDVVPGYLMRSEVKTIFTLIAQSQVRPCHAVCRSNFNHQHNLHLPSSIVAGGTGIDFHSFVKALVMVAIHALSKSGAFSNMYSSVEVRDCVCG